MLGRLLVIAAIGIVGTIAIAGALVIWPWNAHPEQEPGIAFDATLAVEREPLAMETQRLRDGTTMALRRLDGPPDSPIVVMIHGSAWHGMQFEGLARKLAQIADVLVPDLRGHGTAPERRGDVDYIGQLEDDLADLITAHVEPGQPVILLGHSSGGGLAVRFAGGRHRELIDGAVLLAPFLQHDAPTTREDSGGWTLVNLRRIIGLSILNELGIQALNGLPVIRFAMPKEVLDGPLGPTATLEYSYRMNTSLAPRRDWRADVAELPSFLVIAGAEDEAFHAEAYEPVMAPTNPRGRYLVIPDHAHLDIVDADRTAEVVSKFVRELEP